MPELQPLVELVATRSRFEGFCGVDCIEETGTGRRYVLEFNPRMSSGFRYGRDCGVDFSAAVNAWLDPAPPASSPLSLAPGREISAHYFPTDFVRCIRRRDWKGLKNWLPGAKSRHDLCLDDFGVMLASWGARLPQRLLKKAIPAPSRITGFPPILRR